MAGRIEDRGAIAKTLMLMVQTALVLQAFDPGPVDGVFGKRTLAAIAAWQTIQGFPEGAELAGLIAAILRAALVLEGYDPGPVEEMLGPSAIEAAQAWAPSYEQATRNQGSRDRLDRLSPPTSWRTVPHAMDCVSLVRSGGAGNYQFIRNNCDFKLDVHWCYTDRPDDNDFCAPGPAGLGYMDRVGHKATRRGAGPDYYGDSDGLRARETSPKRLELGAIRYIACGHRPLRTHRNTSPSGTHTMAVSGAWRTPRSRTMELRPRGRPSSLRRVWNRIPDDVRGQIHRSCPWKRRSCRPGNWPSGLRTPGATLSRKPRFAGFSRPTT